MKFTRITVNPNQMGGVPCIRGLRIPVATVVGLMADGMTQAQILSAYPDLEAADMNEALQYVAEDLSAQFDGLLQRMQAPKARKGMKTAFNASPAELGRAAVRASAQKR
jgi:uncharacterized protein (DUF433 family)